MCEGGGEHAGVRAAHSLSDSHFRRLSEFIVSECGIRMPPAKKTMLEARLSRRVRDLGLPTMGAYCDYLFGRGTSDGEIVRFIDLVTTNKTDFFREPAHYDRLVNVCLPSLAGDTGTAPGKAVTVWSAGCSSGEEPYTLAMLLAEHALLQAGFRFRILATDISTRTLEKAAAGIYPGERADPVPLPLRRKYMLRSRDRRLNRVRVAPEIRRAVTFRRLNLMDAEYDIETGFGIVFCRNVIIYFDRRNQEGVLERICRHMAPGGYLFLGHSETLFGLNLPLVQEAPTVYRKVRDLP